MSPATLPAETGAPRRTHEPHDVIRAAALRSGLHPRAVKHAELDDLAAVVCIAPALRVVPEPEPEDLCPRLGIPGPWSETADEQASTMYYIRQQREGLSVLPAWFGHGGDPVLGGGPDLGGAA